MKNTIVEATKAHTDIICEIAEKAWWPVYRNNLSAEQIRYMLDTLYSREAVEGQLISGSQSYLLLMEDERTMGFAAFGVREEDPEVYKLHKLYCLPETQGRGYGRSLLEAVCRRVLATGKHILELNVNRNNPAKGFYEKMGFAVAYQEDVPIGPFWMNDFVLRKNLAHTSI